MLAKYEHFKEAIQVLSSLRYRVDHEILDYLYDVIKAKLYNLDWNRTVYNPDGLSNLILEYESEFESANN